MDLERTTDRNLVYIITNDTQWYETLSRAFAQKGMHTAHFRDSDQFLYFMGLFDRTSSRIDPRKMIAHGDNELAPGTIPGGIVLQQDSHQYSHVLEEFAGNSTHIPLHRLPQSSFRNQGVGIVFTHAKNSTFSEAYVQQVAGKAAAGISLNDDPNDADATDIVCATQQSMKNALMEKATGGIPSSGTRQR